MRAHACRPWPGAVRREAHACFVAARGSGWPARRGVRVRRCACSADVDVCRRARPNARRRLERPVRRA
ncbi:hypothetical protein WS83_03525 [Burkholderia sp. MSMB2042]|nr:hypothetical protein WS78_26730 [Burkholderia savannae]KVG44188.1 hypothetical protein WS77_09650 [Burkholderia sp. MSMB0265]KVG96441.1 hypothetical protein WS83_03525 [Burkholderia sp. MSMB2042]KVG97117.1 hypothetical protein WS82_29860 [Burkholderia sp. MSMB2041]